MAKTILFYSVSLALVGVTFCQTTAPTYGQCGGNGWTGPTTCPSGHSCVYSNPWYSQCLPGGPTITTSQPPSGGVSTTTSPTPGGTPTQPAGAIPTLVPGWNFIRAVTAPNFHKYLQSEIKGKVSDAVLGEAISAAQFQIVNGQLIQSASGGGSTLYAVVEPRSSSSVTKLKVSWSETPDTLGSFKFSGDTVEWTSSTVTRPQTNAWLICTDATGNKDVYINLGAYGYQTPADCNDHTIHGFTGTTPD